MALAILFFITCANELWAARTNYHRIDEEIAFNELLGRREEGRRMVENCFAES